MAKDNTRQTRWWEPEFGSGWNGRGSTTWVDPSMALGKVTNTGKPQSSTSKDVEDKRASTNSGGNSVRPSVNTSGISSTGDPGSTTPVNANAPSSDRETNASSGGAPASSPPPYTFNPGEVQTNTPFGNQVMPGEYANSWSNPDSLIRLYFDTMGIPISGGAYGSALQQADALRPLWFLMQNQDVANGYGNYIDWTGDYMNQLFTPGGASVGLRDIAGAISGSIGDPNSVIGNYLNNPQMTAAEQVQQIGSTLRSTVGAAAPSIVAGALLNMAREYGDQYQASSLTSPNGGTFNQYLADKGYWNVFGV